MCSRKPVLVVLVVCACVCVCVCVFKSSLSHKLQNKESHIPCSTDSVLDERLSAHSLFAGAVGKLVCKFFSVGALLPDSVFKKVYQTMKDLLIWPERSHHKVYEWVLTCVCVVCLNLADLACTRSLASPSMIQVVYARLFFKDDSKNKLDDVRYELFASNDAHRICSTVYTCNRLPIAMRILV